MARRTVLFSPGDRPDMCRKAPSTGADTVVFDLEDAVAPARKAEARAAVADLLTDPDFDPAVEVAVRVAADADAAATDLDAVADANRLDAVMVPKANADSVARVADLCSHPILALIETAAGVLDAREVATVPAVDALCFGAEDLAADLGATRTDEGTEVLYAREHVVLSARAAGVDAVDTVYTDLDDHEGLRAETRFAATLGYDGKMVVHPAQVDVVHDALAPDAEAVAWARRVLDARDDADGRGVFEVDGEMIDAPLIARAERILERVPDDE
ncbi:HpcH/HpaI aldolase/citrate lyase family protein [Haloplanus aerogenes]|uniref:Citrate lyase subunit beta/citryl-CoA lyase n=1 Tax=Haloplanus aerogenes TaxID=660522 RepID=A0A3M0EC32_9EURY|nr:CoA ester lyase [Haloplanus aerogenes]AZH25697.1 CoA ester lyase [Haloplanus aerogenes]RMB25430.1 citrate lyase subunit beta/citryl-CoA lyase [Haloplanus aerogenes]